MASGKRSFLLYADYQELFNELDDADAGQLIKHILGYVNDENPETDNPIVKVSFIPIKRQLKRDLEKYELRAERSRKNGSTGGRPPKNPVGYSGNPEEPKKPDNVIVTVNDNDNVIDKETKELADEVSEKWNFSEVDNFNQYKMLICFIEKFGVKKVRDQFLGYWKYKSISEEKTHSFRNWIGPPPDYGGAWIERNWSDALKDFKQKNRISRKNDTVVKTYGELNAN